MADDLTPADDAPAELQSLFFFSPDASRVTVMQPDPPTIVVLGVDDEPLVTIRTDGTLEYGDGYEPDEAARIFWEAVSREAGGGRLAAVTASPRNCRRCHCPTEDPACEHCNCCDIPDPTRGTDWLQQLCSERLATAHTTPPYRGANACMDAWDNGWKAAIHGMVRPIRTVIGPPPAHLRTTEGTCGICRDRNGNPTPCPDQHPDTPRSGAGQ